jgi:hypothetical protein
LKAYRCRAGLSDLLHSKKKADAVITVSAGVRLEYLVLAGEHNSSATGDPLSTIPLSRGGDEEHAQGV